MTDIITQRQLNRNLYTNIPNTERNNDIYETAMAMKCKRGTFSMLAEKYQIRNQRVRQIFEREYIKRHGSKFFTGTDRITSR